MMIPASIVIPTRARLSYLEVALASIAPQAAAAGAEVLVVDDAGASPAARALAERYGARYEPHAAPLGLNVARNTGVQPLAGRARRVRRRRRARRPRLARGAARGGARAPGRRRASPGRIVPRLEGRSPRSCGREGPPITTLDLGREDTDAATRGARTWRSAAARSSASGRSTYRSRTAATSRSGRTV